MPFVCVCVCVCVCVLYCVMCIDVKTDSKQFLEEIPTIKWN